MPEGIGNFTFKQNSACFNAFSDHTNEYIQNQNMISYMNLQDPEPGTKSLQHRQHIKNWLNSYGLLKSID
jgi:hypothetical protein